MLFVDIRKYVTRGSASDRDQDIGHVHCPRGATLTLFRSAAIFLFIAALLTLAKELLGEPIKCSGLNGGHKGEKFFDQFCWIQGTRSILTPESVKEEFRTVEALPGIRSPSFMEMDCKFDPTKTYERADCKSRTRHNYYIWVPFVLFLQAVACYLPVYLWKNWDSQDKIHRYIRKCDKPVEDKKPAKKRRMGYVGIGGGGSSDEDNPEGGGGSRVAVAGRKCSVDLEALARALLRQRGAHGVYGSKFVLSHAIGFALLVAQLHLVNVFLGGNFVSYGLTLLGVADFPIVGTNLTTNTWGAMNSLFPIVTECELVSISVNGRKEIIHGMCAISFNLINQQIYWLVFALYMVLTVWTALSLVGHILLKFVPELRSAVIWTQMPRGIRFKQVAGLINPMCFSDWFILRRTLDHFDSHGRESLLNCVLRAINRQNNPDLRRISGDGNSTLIVGSDGSNSSVAKPGKYFELSI